MKPLQPNSIALFDFDGTITNSDTMFAFLRFGFPQFGKNMFNSIPDFIKLALKLQNNQTTKEKLLSRFFKGLSVEELNQIGNQFCQKKLPELIKESALQEIKNHLTLNNEVFIITASAENWVKPWCNQLKINIIGTILEEENGLLTGKLNGKNCHGIEKVSRINAAINLKIFDHIYAYGDTKGDKYMLDLADFKYYKYFN